MQEGLVACGSRAAGHGNQESIGQIGVCGWRKEGATERGAQWPRPAEIQGATIYGKKRQGRGRQQELRLECVRSIWQENR